MPTQSDALFVNGEYAKRHYLVQYCRESREGMRRIMNLFIPVLVIPGTPYAYTVQVVGSTVVGTTRKQAP